MLGRRSRQHFQKQYIFSYVAVVHEVLAPESQLSHFCIILFTNGVLSQGHAG